MPPVNEHRMTLEPAIPESPAPFPSPAPGPSIARRWLVALAGLGLFIIMIVITMGLALAAPIGMAIAGAVQTVRRYTYSATAGWLGAVAACAVVTLVLSVFVMRHMPAGSFDAAMQKAMEEQQRHPPPLTRTLQRFSPGGAAAPVIQSQTNALMNTPGFRWIIILIGSVMGGSCVGLLIGTPAWGCATLIMFGITGRWPRRTSSSL